MTEQRAETPPAPAVDDAAAEALGEFVSDSLRVVGRRGDTVVRRPGWWTPAVHHLLAHLESAGFAEAPQLREPDEQGNEAVVFIPGVSGLDAFAEVVPERGLRRFARLLRRYHDAVRTYRPARDAEWMTEVGSTGPGQIVAHGDFGPWNTVWRDHRPVGLLDWDQAGPRPLLYDVGYALEYTVPFRDDLECTDWLRYPEPPDRARRMAVFADAYGLDSTDGLYDAVLDVQRRVRAAHLALAERGHEPHASWVRDGFEDAQQRRIDWTVANRDLFP